MVSSYTANLAAFLTTEDTDPAFENAQQLVERADTAGISYGALAKGATATLFLQALVGITLFRFYSDTLCLTTEKS